MKKYRINIYRDNINEWRWNLKAGNNKIIATSGEGYNNYVDCMHAVNIVVNLNHTNSRIKGLVKPSNVDIIVDHEI